MRYKGVDLNNVTNITTQKFQNAVVRGEGENTPPIGESRIRMSVNQQITYIGLYLFICLFTYLFMHCDTVAIQELQLS